MNSLDPTHQALHSMQDLLSLIRQLGSEKISEREDAEKRLPEYLSLFFQKIKSSSNVCREDQELIEEIKKQLESFLLLMLESVRWEDRSAGITLLSFLTDQLPAERLWTLFLNHLKVLFDDKEGRVRQQVSKIIGKFTFLLGGMILTAVESLIFKTINEEINNIGEEQSNLSKNYNDNYKKIESSINTLIEILENLRKKGDGLGEREMKEILNVIELTAMNQRKYIRINSLSLMQIYIDILPQKEFEELQTVFFKFIQAGLSDNFTEVRFAATKTVFQYLAKIKNSPNFEKIRLSLIPKICFNRLYPAESFSKESLRLWKELVGNEGVKLLRLHASESIEYYISQGEMTNSEIRETSCKSIRELSTKVIEGDAEAKGKLMKKRDSIVNALQKLCLDNSYQVRENALYAVTGIIESNNGLITPSEAFQIGLDHLPDSFHDARSNAVTILSIVCQLEIKNDPWLKIKDYFSQTLEKTDLHHEHHTENNNDIQHIHLSDLVDGGVAVFKEILSILKKFPDLMKKNMDFIDGYLKLIVSKLYLLKNDKSEYIRDNIFKNLSGIANLVAKEIIKKHLEGILEHTFEQISNLNPQKNSSSMQSAKNLIKDLQKVIGPNILKGRVENMEQGKWIKLYSEI